MNKHFVFVYLIYAFLLFLAGMSALDQNAKWTIYVLVGAWLIMPVVKKINENSEERD